MLLARFYWTTFKLTLMNFLLVKGHVLFGWFLYMRKLSSFFLVL